MRLFAFAGLIAFGAGCRAHVPYRLSDADAEKYAPVVRMHVAGRDAPIILGMYGCEVYRAEFGGDEISGWQKVLSPGGGFLAVCNAASSNLTYDGRKVHAVLCTTRFGAGGGCAGYLDEVSTDGAHWKRRT